MTGDENNEIGRNTENAITEYYAGLGLPVLHHGRRYNLTDSMYSTLTYRMGYVEDELNSVNLQYYDHFDQILDILDIVIWDELEVPEICEIKTQIGPDPSFKVTLSYNQGAILLRLYDRGIRSGVIYAIAKPRIHFTLIKTRDIYERVENVSVRPKWNSRGQFNLRIPQQHRDLDKYTWL